MTESEERIVKRLCDAIYYLFKKLKRFFVCVFPVVRCNEWRGWTWIET